MISRCLTNQICKDSFQTRLYSGVWIDINLGEHYSIQHSGCKVRSRKITWKQDGEAETGGRETDLIRNNYQQPRILNDQQGSSLLGTQSPQQLFLWPAQHTEWALKPTQVQGLGSLPGPERLQLLSQGQQRHGYMHPAGFHSFLLATWQIGWYHGGHSLGDWKPWVLVLTLQLAEFGTQGTSRERGRPDHFQNKDTVSFSNQESSSKFTGESRERRDLGPQCIPSPSRDLALFPPHPPKNSGVITQTWK